MHNVLLGLTGGAATITKKILASKQMKVRQTKEIR